MLPKYKRILLKLSGGTIMGNSEQDFEPFNANIIEQYAMDIKLL